jgi:hypothetical protein
MEKTAKKSMFWLFTWVFILATLWNSLALIWWNWVGRGNEMSKEEEFYRKVFRTIDGCEEDVVILLKSSMLRQVGIEVGDTFTVEVRGNELVIRKEWLL